MKKIVLTCLCVLTLMLVASHISTAQTRILVFSKTAGFRHSSIPKGITAIQKLGGENGFTVDASEDAALFSDETLKKYAAIVFLSTTGNILDDNQQAAFERYIKAGHGLVGIHAAADTEYDWEWYGKAIGAYFESHPKTQQASLLVKDKQHFSTKHLPSPWVRTDEWYNYKNLNKAVHVLITLDETSYTGGKNGDHHPIAWYHEFDGGRVFYTGLGHTDESFTEQNFMRHVLAGIQYAMGKK